MVRFVYRCTQAQHMGQLASLGQDGDGAIGLADGLTVKVSTLRSVLQGRRSLCGYAATHVISVASWLTVMVEYLLSSFAQLAW
jgi:hypothetical protein